MTPQGCIVTTDLDRLHKMGFTINERKKIMTIAIGLAFLVMLVGLIGYYVASNPKYLEIFRIMFFVGLFFVVGAGDKIGAWIG
jgi:hypothetical protein